MLLLTGCVGTHDSADLYRPRFSPRSQSLHKPVVAVVEFENRSSFRGQWHVGSGMADLLVTHLLETDRFVVLERKALDQMLKELRLQDTDLFRDEGRVDTGRLRSAQYLIRGVITDFTVTGDASGWFSTGSERAKLMGSRARVAMNLMVFEVENGEVLHSVETSGSVGSFGLGGTVTYKDYTFGSDAFFRTPLGKACTQAMKKAIADIEDAIPLQPWSPRVAEVSSDGHVIVSGGKNVGMEAGTVYTVLGEPHRVTDPSTGNVIETLPGDPKGRIQIREVRALASHGQILSGTAVRGDDLEREPD